MNKGDVLGKITISTNDYVIYTKDIVLDCDIKKKKPNDYILEILTHLLDNTERI
jgi:hypothetical protein